MSNQFAFDGKLKMFTLLLMLVGIACLGLSIALDNQHNLIWLTNLLHNSVFFLGISFAALLFISTHTMAWGGWQTLFKRIPEAMMMFLPFGALCLGIIVLLIVMEVPGIEYLYAWTDHALLDKDNECMHDELLEHKSAFLKVPFYALTIVIVLIWTFFAIRIRKLSIQQDKNKALGIANMNKTRFWSAIFLPVAGFSSAYAIWQWVMSVDAHWYSTLFAWYVTVSVWVSAISLILLIAIFLKSRDHLPYFSRNHIHDLGKYIFGFSVFWTYLWFSQFLLIWYANNGEETQYFYLRFDEFKPIFFINLIFNFILPFFILMMNSSKRTFGTIGFTAGLVILGHWIDLYQMIKPGAWYNKTHHEHLVHDCNHGDRKHNSHKEEHGDVYRPTKRNFNDGKAQLTYYQSEEDDETSEHTYEDHSQLEDNPSHTYATEDSDHKQETDYLQSATNGSPSENDPTHRESTEANHQHEKQFIMGIHFPGILELGTFLGFLGGFLFITFTFLSKASLKPLNDPYMGESEHHEVWPFPSENHDNHH